MTIKAKQYVEVEIDERQAREIAISTIKKLANLPTLGQYEHLYIKDNNLYKHWDDSRGSHSYYGEALVRPASDLDKAAVLIINTL